MSSVDRPEPVSPTDPLTQVDRKSSPSSAKGASFDAHMQQNAFLSEQQNVDRASLFELEKGNHPLSLQPNLDHLLQQVHSSQTQLAAMTHQLRDKNIEAQFPLRKSERTLIGKKLDSANDHLSEVHSKLGISSSSFHPPRDSKKGGILAKFLDYIDAGQTNLEGVQKHLTQMKNQGTSLNPADFMMIQLKLGHAQQEIEYASMMLAKAVEGIRTLMNIQL